MRPTSPETHILLLNRTAATVSATALTSLHPIQKGPNTQKNRGFNVHTHAALGRPSERKTVASWDHWHRMGTLTLLSHEIGLPQHIPETEETVPQSSAEHPRGVLLRQPALPWGGTSAITLHMFYNVSLQPREYTYTSLGSNTGILTFNIIPPTPAVLLQHPQHVH